MKRDEISIRMGQKIRMAREARGMTLDELSEKIGYTHRSSMSLIELGKRSVTTTKAQLIAQALRVDVLWLVSEDDNPPVFIEQSPIEKIFEQLSPANKANLIQYAEFLIKQQEIQNGQSTNMVE